MSTDARIGPNAILQLVPVLDGAVGRHARDALFTAAGIDDVPSGERMIEEAPVARLHQTLRRELPKQAVEVSRAAGLATGDYILRHRIPKAAQALLKVLPVPLSSRLLAKAIARHAWTFAGSGRFRIESLTPLVFEIADNPVVRGERSRQPVCHWHAAVFERLYRVLVAGDYRATECACGACGAPACRFELRRSGS